MRGHFYHVFDTVSGGCDSCMEVTGLIVSLQPLYYKLPEGAEL